MGAQISILSNRVSELSKLKSFFEIEGFSVSTFSNFTELFFKEIYEKQPEVIFLDLEIENSDGIELCHQLKLENEISSYVVLYTTHREDYIQVEAFNAGADDYIIRPINSRLLLKKINALLKRKAIHPVQNKSQIIAHNNLKVDRESYLVFNEGREIYLPKKEFEMLFLLIKTPQKAFSREEIFRQVWKDENCINTRIIDVYIRKIREQTGQNTIKTIKGVGYQLA